MVQPKQHLVDLFRGVGCYGSRHGYLRLDMNESVEGLPESFVRGVFDSITSEDIATYPEYDEVISMFADSEALAPRNVMVTNGSDAAIKHLFEAYVDDGDRVLVTDPTFAMYSVYSKIFGARDIAVPYRDDLSFPSKAFIKAVEHYKPKIAVVVNPNNPTGTRIGQSTIRILAEICRANECLLLVDEAYFHYLNETAAGLVFEFDNVVVLRTFSKLAGLAGLRVGYALANEDIIIAMGKVKSTFEVNFVALAMVKAILSHPVIFKQQLSVVAEGKNWLLKKLDDNKIPYVVGHTNFILIDCGERCSKIAELLKRDSILVSAGFRQSFLKKYLRVTLAGPQNMKRFWQSFKFCLEKEKRLLDEASGIE